MSQPSGHRASQPSGHWASTSQPSGHWGTSQSSGHWTPSPGAMQPQWLPHLQNVSYTAPPTPVPQQLEPYPAHFFGTGPSLPVFPLRFASGSSWAPPPPPLPPPACLAPPASLPHQPIAFQTQFLGPGPGLPVLPTQYAFTDPVVQAQYRFAQQAALTTRQTSQPIQHTFPNPAPVVPQTAPYQMRPQHSNQAQQHANSIVQSRNRQSLNHRLGYSTSNSNPNNSNHRAAPHSSAPERRQPRSRRPTNSRVTASESRASRPTDSVSDTAKRRMANIHALAKKVLNSLESVAIADLPEEDRSCSICYNKYGTETPEGVTENPLRLPKCRHVFGNHCMEEWLKQKKSCPYCREPLDVAHHFPSSGPAFVNLIRLRTVTSTSTATEEVVLRLMAGEDSTAVLRSIIPTSVGSGFS